MIALMIQILLEFCDLNTADKQIRAIHTEQHFSNWLVGLVAKKMQQQDAIFPQNCLTEQNRQERYLEVNILART